MSDTTHTAARAHTSLVTGATSGIGAAIVAALSAAGYKVFATGRNPDALARLAALPGVTAIQADVRDTDTLCSLLGDARIDSVINNAGQLTTTGPFVGTDPSQIDTMIDINLKAPIRLTHKLLPAMIERRAGHLVFVGSIAGHAAFPGSCVYGASKSGIGVFCDALRCELLGSGVRVTELVPGRVETSLYRDTHGPDGAKRALYDGYRSVQPHDVAGLVRTVLELPDYVDISRMEIMPTDQAAGGGSMVKFAAV
ncbi:MAG: SDR family oxidoreductase [Acetobacter sp.]|uniref:SDR family oxidoreductase n=1 Tax=Acetobacter sp. TaxID=440 RepID=UPI0039EAA856